MPIRFHYDRTSVIPAFAARYVIDELRSAFSKNFRYFAARHVIDGGGHWLD